MAILKEIVTLFRFKIDNTSIAKFNTIVGGAKKKRKRINRQSK